MDWKRNDIHRIVVFEARLHHVTSCTLVYCTRQYYVYVYVLHIRTCMHTS